MKSSVLFVFALFTGAALFGQTVSDFTYKVNNGAVTITGYTGSATDITIPGRIDGLPVTGIGNGAFREKQLTGVNIPANVTTFWILSFPGNLAEVYTEGGSRAGTYASDDDGETWARQ